MILSRTLRLAAVPVLFCLSSLSHASFIVYNTQAAFNTATTAQGVDSLNGLSITSPTASPLIRTAGAYGYTAISTLSTGGADTFYGAGSSADGWLSTNFNTSTITFTNFVNGPLAIGGNFFGSNISGLFASGNIIVTAVDATGSLSQTITSATINSFLGFVSTGGLTSLSVTAVQGTTSLWPTVNNLILARAAAVTPPAGTVPEPASTALLLGGLGIMAMLARRRRS